MNLGSAYPFVNYTQKSAVLKYTALLADNYEMSLPIPAETVK
jgi:hypothetical protein